MCGSDGELHKQMSLYFSILKKKKYIKHLLLAAKDNITKKQ